MLYSITFLEPQFTSLLAHLFSASDQEQAAFLLARQVKTERTLNLLVRKVIPVVPFDILSASHLHMSIASRAYLRAMKQADLENCSFIFVHSHPGGFAEFSAQDDQEELPLFKTAHTRIHHEAVHASLVFPNKHSFCGRAWHADGSMAQIETIRVIGDRFRFLFRERTKELPLEYFDRQVRAFTSEFQPLLQRLHVGVVGVGGTGSAVCEQLIRLGIGHLTIIDHGTFEKSNVNRVYGSTVFDEDLPKVNITARSAATIGLKTQVERVQGHLSFKSVARRLLDCDIVFGCTDDEWGRSILNRLALFHCIPIFDMGVNIDAADGKILSIQGRVTTLMPGAACLSCRKRISPERIRAESIAACDPEEAARLRKEGYLVGVDEPAPSVISFTSGIASTAISEFLHRLTGFQGTDRKSTEVICLFDQSRIRTNATPPNAGCLCANAEKWAAGDIKRFLDLNWRKE